MKVRSIIRATRACARNTPRTCALAPRISWVALMGVASIRQPEPSAAAVATTLLMLLLWLLLRLALPNQLRVLVMLAALGAALALVDVAATGVLRFAAPGGIAQATLSATIGDPASTVAAAGGLALAAGLLVALLLALPLGILAAVRRDTPWDSGAMGFSMLGVSIPNFWLGAAFNHPFFRLSTLAAQFRDRRMAASDHAGHHPGDLHYRLHRQATAPFGHPEPGIGACPCLEGQRDRLPKSSGKAHI